MVGAGIGKSETERLGSGRRREVGSRGEAYRDERSVVRNDDDVGGRARVTTNKR